MKEYIVEYETEQIENSTFFYGGKIKRELILCKDCKYNPYNPRNWADDDTIFCFCHCPYMSTDGEHYCSEAKPKDNRK